MLNLCRKIVKYHANGDPIKDAIEPSPYRNDELLVLLAAHYVSAMSGRKEKADL